MSQRPSKRKFSRKTGQRRAFMRSLAVNVIRRGKIETTVIRAKAIRPVVEKAVTLAKKKDLSARRILMSRLGDEHAVSKLINELAPKYENRKGGYMRITASGKVRKRDGVRVATIEFV